MLISAAKPKQDKDDITGKQPFASINPNACFSVSPGDPTLIKITNATKMRHYNHPINKLLRNVNEFCFLTMIKANQSKGSVALKPPSFDIP